MTYFPACAGSEEEGPTNFTPPVTGSEVRLMESRRRKLSALDKLAKETVKFHETMAEKHGLDTSRGLAHFRAAKSYREVKNLEKFFECHEDAGELNPKAVIATNTEAVKFHKSAAKKAGLSSDEGHAHVHAVERCMAAIKEARTILQERETESAEGGPGSGPRKGGGKGRIGLATSEVQQQGKGLAYSLSKDYGLPTIANSLSSIMDKGADPAEIEGLANFVSSAQRGPKHSEEERQDVASKLYKLAEWAETARSKDSKEAKFGHSSKKSPFPGVPRKKDMPSEDIRQNKPALPLRRLQQQKASQYLAPRYEKSHQSEGGPGSGPRKGGGTSRFMPPVGKAAQDRAGVTERVNRLRKLATRFERAGNKSDALKMKNRINTLLGESRQ